MTDSVMPRGVKVQQSMLDNTPIDEFFYQDRKTIYCVFRTSLGGCCHSARHTVAMCRIHRGFVLCPDYKCAFI